MGIKIRLFNNSFAAQYAHRVKLGRSSASPLLLLLLLVRKDLFRLTRRVIPERVRTKLNECEFEVMELFFAVTHTRSQIHISAHGA